MSITTGEMSEKVSIKNLAPHRELPEVENFYRFLNDNNLRKEAGIVIEKVLKAMKAKKASSKGSKRGRKRKSKKVLQ